MAIELVFQTLRDQPIGRAGALHNRAARGSFTAHKKRDANDAFVSHDRDLCRCAIFHHVQERDDGVSRKIYVAQDIARLVQPFAERQFHKLQMRVHALAYLG